MSAAGKRLGFAAVAVAVLSAAWLSGVSALISLDTLRAHRLELAQFVGGHFWRAALIYVAVYIAVSALSLPGAALLTLAGGFLFGPAAGAALTVAGATAGATVAFLSARAVFGNATLDRFGEQGRRLAENIRRNAWPYMLALRLAPVFPFFLVNIVPAFAGVRPAAFIWTTLIGIIPGTMALSLSGSGLGAALHDTGNPNAVSFMTPELAAGLTALAVLSLAAIPLRHYSERGETRHDERKTAAEAD